MPNELCPDLVLRIEQLGNQYVAALRANNGALATEILNAITLVHNEMVWLKCVPGLYTAPGEPTV